MTTILPRSLKPLNEKEPQMRITWALKDVARVLGVKPFRIQYALATGAVAEPEHRISGRRVFELETLSAWLRTSK